MSRGSRFLLRFLMYVTGGFEYSQGTRSVSDGVLL